MSRSRAALRAGAGNGPGTGSLWQWQTRPRSLEEGAQSEGGGDARVRGKGRRGLPRTEHIVPVDFGAEFVAEEHSQDGDGVGEALEGGVHEAGVAQVGQAHDASPAQQHGPRDGRRVPLRG